MCSLLLVINRVSCRVSWLLLETQGVTRQTVLTLDREECGIRATCDRWGRKGVIGGVGSGRCGGWGSDKCGRECKAGG